MKVEERQHITEAREIQVGIYKKMSYAEKWREMVQLGMVARQLKRAGLKLRHSEWTDEDLDKKVAEIFRHART